MSSDTAHGSPARWVLTVGSRELLTPGLINRVSRACDWAEDADSQPAAMLVQLHPGGDGDQSWPGRVGVHTVNHWERVLRRLERAAVAIVATAHGQCSAAAAELLLVSDYRLGTPDFSFRLFGSGCRPWPGTGLYRSVAQLGLAKARRLALHGTDVSSRQALDWALLDQVCPDQSALSIAANAAVEMFAELPGKELAVRRRLLHDALTSTFEDAIGAHLAACDRTLRMAGSPTAIATAVP